MRVSAIAIAVAAVFYGLSSAQSLVDTDPDTPFPTFRGLAVAPLLTVALSVLVGTGLLGAFAGSRFAARVLVAGLELSCLFHIVCMGFLIALLYSLPRPSAETQGFFNAMSLQAVVELGCLAVGSVLGARAMRRTFLTGDPRERETVAA